MVPMLTWGLVRSNFAFATGCSLRMDCFAVRRTGLLAVFVAGITSFDERSLASGLLDDLLRDALGNFGVGVELHAVARPALGAAAQVAHVTEHLRQRYLRA